MCTVGMDCSLVWCCCCCPCFSGWCRRCRCCYCYHCVCCCCCSCVCSGHSCALSLIFQALCWKLALATSDVALCLMSSKWTESLRAKDATLETHWVICCCCLSLCVLFVVFDCRNVVRCCFCDCYYHCCYCYCHYHCYRCSLFVVFVIVIIIVSVMLIVIVNLILIGITIVVLYCS